MDLQQIWNAVLTFFSDSGWRIVTFLAVLVVGVLIVRALCYAIGRIMLRSRVDKTLTGFIVTVCRFVLYLVLVFVLAGVLGIDLSPLASAISAGLVAIGLALQNSLSNIANGVIIIYTRPFKEGDYVKIGSVTGTIKSIGLFVTELVSDDNKKVVMTNSNVINDTISNYSERLTRRVDMLFSVSYDTDIEKAKNVIKELIDAHPLTLNEPAPVVRLHEFKDSCFNIVTRMWVKNENYWAVYWDMNESVFAAFKENGIEIPFNQIDVHVKEDK